eukprot:Ihof_evm1s454 gene=Ihof_evmTU1s454
MVAKKQNILSTRDESESDEEVVFDDNEEGESEEEVDENDESEEEVDENESSGEEEEEEEDREATLLENLRQEIADTPFEELQAMKERLGTKRFDAMMKSISGAPQKQKPVEKKTKKTQDDYKRLGKNRPREMSSKKQVSRLRQVAEVKTNKTRDPRFDSLSGHYNEDLFEKTYAFLDDIKKVEVEEVKKELGKTKDLDRRTQLQSLLTKMQQDEKRKNADKKKQELKRQLRKAEREAVAQGKKPFYLKKSEEKKMELVTKFNTIKESGK